MVSDALVHCVALSDLNIYLTHWMANSLREGTALLISVSTLGGQWPPEAPCQDVVQAMGKLARVPVGVVGVEATLTSCLGCLLLLFSRSVVSDSLRPCGL